MVSNVDVDSNKFYSISETCALLGLHRNTLRRYTKENRIAFVTRSFDGKVLYSGAEIERIIKTTI